jgi:hypothetical protein
MYRVCPFTHLRKWFRDAGKMALIRRKHIHRYLDTHTSSKQAFHGCPSISITKTQPARSGVMHVSSSLVSPDPESFRFSPYSSSPSHLPTHRFGKTGSATLIHSQLRKISMGMVKQRYSRLMQNVDHSCESFSVTLNPFEGR